MKNKTLLFVWFYFAAKHQNQNLRLNFGLPIITSPSESPPPLFFPVCDTNRLQICELNRLTLQIWLIALPPPLPPQEARFCLKRWWVFAKKENPPKLKER